MATLVRRSDKATFSRPALDKVVEALVVATPEI